MADLTTLANVKQWLQIPADNTTNDALLSRLITAASDFIETWCNRTFALSSYKETRDGQGGSRLMFSDYPVTAVAKIGVDFRDVLASNGQGGPGYVFDSTGVTLFGRMFTRGLSNVVLEYTAGFATTPPGVEQACIELVGERYKTMDRIGMISKTLAGEVITFSTADMSDSVKTELNEYRKVVPV